MEVDCLKEIRRTNCRKDHPDYARSGDVYKKEKKILEVKSKRNVSFLQAKNYMGESSYDFVARRANTTNQDNKYRTLVEKLIQLEANDGPKFQEQLKKLHPTELYRAPAQPQIGNGVISNVVVQIKPHEGSTTPTRTNSKSAKSPTKQLLHTSLIRPPKSIKGWLNNLSPIRPEQLKQKSQAPINQARKIQMNTNVNKERPGTTFKMPSRTKSLVRIKQCKAQGSTKSLQRTYSTERMDCNTDNIFASLNIEEIINTYNNWNNLTVGKFISPISFLKGVSSWCNG